MLIKCLEEWLGKHLLELGSIECPLVLSGLLERMCHDIGWISHDLVNLIIGLLHILLLVATNRLNFYHFLECF